jgi:hypothetical protein
MLRNACRATGMAVNPFEWANIDVGTTISDPV